MSNHKCTCGSELTLHMDMLYDSIDLTLHMCIVLSVHMYMLLTLHFTYCITLSIDSYTAVHVVTG